MRLFQGRRAVKEGKVALLKTTGRGGASLFPGAPRQPSFGFSRLGLTGVVLSKAIKF